MSTTHIPDKVKVLLFGASAGRCEYRGCNKLLTLDDLTGRPANLSAFAHIVADSAEGPRGDTVQSPLLGADIGNLMTLCLDHHKLIDVDAVAEHPVELLRTMKAEHEARIRRLTDIQGQHRTHVVALEANIGDRKGHVDRALVREALLPMYAVGDPVSIDLTHLRVEDGDELYWKVGTSDIKTAIQTLHERVARSEVKHVSVFGLAPIPLLMALGLQVGDLVHGRVFQRSRPPADHWRWDTTSTYTAPMFDVRRPEAVGSGTDVGLVFEVSDSGAEPLLRGLLGEPTAIYVVRVASPGVDQIRCEAQLSEFRTTVRQLLHDVRGVYGANAVIHVLAAIPNSLAIEFGRLLLPKSDPEIWVYDLNRLRGGFAVPLVLLPPLGTRT